MTYPVDEQIVPTTQQAVRLYESHRVNAHLTTEYTFGVDPLEGDALRTLERDRVMSQLPSPAVIFGLVVNGNFMLYHHAIRVMIDTSFRLAA